jgi:hypothetical protein
MTVQKDQVYYLISLVERFIVTGNSVLLTIALVKPHLFILMLKGQDVWQRMRMYHLICSYYLTSKKMSRCINKEPLLQCSNWTSLPKAEAQVKHTARSLHYGKQSFNTFLNVRMFHYQKKLLKNMFYRWLYLPFLIFYHFCVYLYKHVWISFYYFMEIKSDKFSSLKQILPFFLSHLLVCDITIYFKICLSV